MSNLSQRHFTLKKAKAVRVAKVKHGHIAKAKAKAHKASKKASK